MKQPKTVLHSSEARAKFFLALQPYKGRKLVLPGVRPALPMIQIAARGSLLVDPDIREVTEFGFSTFNGDSLDHFTWEQVYYLTRGHEILFAKTKETRIEAQTRITAAAKHYGETLCVE